MGKTSKIVGALVVLALVAFAAFKVTHMNTSEPGAAMQATTPPAATAAATTPATTPAASTTPTAGTQTADAGDLPLYPDDMYMGKADAKVTVIEYASLSCPHCAKFNAEVLPKLKTEYIDKGLVRWVYRDYPLNNAAYLAAVLAHCASPLRFFGLVDTLFRSQDYWAAQTQALPALKQIGVSEGVDEKTYDACLADQKLKDKILARLQEADSKFKVNATPSFFIRGELHAGEIPYDDFKKLIDDALGHS